jgi:hypothetical protein
MLARGLVETLHVAFLKICATFCGRRNWIQFSARAIAQPIRQKQVPTNYKNEPIFPIA